MMHNHRLLVLLLIVVPISSCLSQQQTQSITEAGIDKDGNIYVGSDVGRTIKMSTVQHCIEARSAEDRQTIGCSVARGGKPEEAMQSTRLEVFLRNGKLIAIETETPMDWHFWQRGKQVAVHTRSNDGKDHYALFDTVSGSSVEELTDPLDGASLPQWAKSIAQIEDESVPVGEDLTRERTKWIAKALRQIGKVEPGMKRQDLLNIFTTEGGLSTRFQRTYVYTECPYIKVNVGFKPARQKETSLEEDPDDIIESISQPFLAWSVMD